jgi:hypothetical protein
VRKIASAAMNRKPNMACTMSLPAMPRRRTAVRQASTHSAQASNASGQASQAGWWTWPAKGRAKKAWPRVCGGGSLALPKWRSRASMVSPSCCRLAPDSCRGTSLTPPQPSVPSMVANCSTEAPLSASAFDAARCGRPCSSSAMKEEPRVAGARRVQASIVKASARLASIRASGPRLPA